MRSVCNTGSIQLMIFGVLRFFHISDEFNEMFENCDDMRAVFEANKVVAFTYEG